MARASEAYCEDGIFQAGIGQVVVCRYKSGGRVEAGLFLVDVFCLGVKDAFFRTFDGEEFEGFLSKTFPDGIPEPQPGSWGRKLVEEAARYAASLGFSPHSDYKKGAKVFGGVDASECDEEFVMGSEGKPLYVQGPYDDRVKAERILATLQAKLGDDGFHYVMPMDFEEECDEEDEEDDIGILAMDSEADEGGPDRILVTFAENFRDQHDGYGEMEYRGKIDAKIAASLLREARKLQEEMASESAQEMPLDEAIRYIQTLWNIRALPEEDREIVFREVPEPMADVFREAIAQTDGEAPMGDALILDFLVLKADAPGEERLFVLTEFF